jgi:hypothetical protein
MVARDDNFHVMWMRSKPQDKVFDLFESSKVGKIAGVDQHVSNWERFGVAAMTIVRVGHADERHLASLVIGLADGADAVVANDVAIVCFSSTAAGAQLVTSIGAIAGQRFARALGVQELEEEKRRNEDADDSCESDTKATIIERSSSNAANDRTVASW